jgi:hypothetical protein
MKTTSLPIGIVLLIGQISGCQNTDSRIAEMAREEAARQAEQSRQMAQLQQEVAAGSRQLVEADSQARQELVGLQRELRADQAETGRQRDALETERRQIVAERRWDSTVGSAIAGAAGLLACLLPILLCFAVLRGLRASQQTESALSELLVQELTADRPRLLPPADGLLRSERPKSIPRDS